jgi:hypothetical protein
MHKPEAEGFFAGGDIGLVSDSSALAIVGVRGREIHLMDLLELRPERGRPLKLSNVIASFAERLESFGIRSFMADGWSREPAREYTDACGLTISAAPEGQAGKVAVYVATRDAMREGRLHLGMHLRLRAQLRSITSTPVAGGGLKISAPRRGGHGDLVSAVTLAVSQACASGSEINLSAMMGDPHWAACMGLSRMSSEADDFLRPPDDDDY